jgi:hypothetical protein
VEQNLSSTNFLFHPPFRLCRRYRESPRRTSAPPKIGDFSSARLARALHNYSSLLSKLGDLRPLSTHSFAHWAMQHVGRTPRACHENSITILRLYIRVNRSRQSRIFNYR